MASECNSPDHNTHLEMDKEDESVKRWSSISDTTTGLGCNSSNGFDCNICLEFVQDPVVSLCGHLYCWPCIYKWIHFNSVSDENSDHGPQCPVCKAQVSVSALVPLYGRGKDMKPCDREAPNYGLTIPQRPCAPIYRGTSSTPPLRHNQQIPEPYHTHDSPFAASTLLRLGGTNSIRPIIEIFGEMVYPRMFGQSVSNAYNHSNSYNMASAQSPRMRRQLMREDQSLSRLCFFFFCCMILCLLLF